MTKVQGDGNDDDCGKEGEQHTHALAHAERGTDVRNETKAQDPWDDGYTLPRQHERVLNEHLGDVIEREHRDGGDERHARAPSKRRLKGFCIRLLGQRNPQTPK